MLKKLPFTAISTLTKILNACILLQTVSSAWHKGLIWPIPKKGYYPGGLSKTCPITLIEHIQKIFTKILTAWLNLILLWNDLLDPANNVALLLISTLQPIQHITHFREDAHINKKKLWILSQDMSKAYNTVYILLLQKALHWINTPPQFTNLISNIFGS